MQIYLETNHTARSGARTGIQTVVRGLLSGLSKHVEVCPVRWSYAKESLTPLKPKWEKNLDFTSDRKRHLPLSSLFRPSLWPLWFQTFGMNYKTPIHLHPAYTAELNQGWLILPELVEGKHAREAAAYAKKHGMKTAGIFYDAIPWLHPEIVRHWTKEQHADYMAGFATFDVVIPISEQSARDYIQFLESQGIPLPPVHACPLAAQIFGQDRITQLKPEGGDVVKILYVSTLEPRKNHIFLLDAFEEASARLQGKNVELHLVGSEYKNAPEIAEAVRAASAKNPRIIWHGRVENDELRKFYSECDFTIYASRIEGYGLPVMESLWFGRPCICSDEGVIAENAREGGCLMVDMRDTKSVADGIVKLAGDPAARRELGEQVLRRKLETWDEYGAHVYETLKKI